MVRDAAWYGSFFSAMRECEIGYPVAEWAIDGIPVWPMARIESRTELFLGRYHKNKKGGRRRLDLIEGAARALHYAVSPILSPLENYRDWQHETLRFRPTDALFLGDGVSHDFIQGVWRDRYCAPIIEALQADGKKSFLMQPLKQRVPRERATYSVEWIDSWAKLQARTRRARNIHLPAFSEVRKFLKKNGIDFMMLDPTILERFAVRVGAMAGLFDHILRRTAPKLAFTVSYYSPMGYAFNVACRKRHILSVDIQHGGQDGSHEAYNHWFAVPAKGYAVMPAVFWNWSESDARAIHGWANTTNGWHRSLPAGHPQLAAWYDMEDWQTRHFDTKIAEIQKRHCATFDILVALQNTPGYDATWERLTSLIISSPPSWRWWLRRHPVGRADPSLEKLLSMKRSNIFIEEASALPLPALLRNVNAVLTLMSSTVFEASSFGHRPIFMTEDALLFWPSVITSGTADVISDMDELQAHLRRLENSPPKTSLNSSSPLLKNTIHSLFQIAQKYAAMSQSGS